MLGGHQLKFKKLVPEAIIPTRGTKFSAGLDLYTYRPITVIPLGVTPIVSIDGAERSCGRMLVRTGLSVEIPPGTYGRVASRSSLALDGLEVGAGVIDSDYRGEIMVLLRNFTNNSIELQAGSKIAQLIITPLYQCLPIEAQELSDTARGMGGFGSTDKKETGGE
jgi:dUTP pyrophosphatase